MRKITSIFGILAALALLLTGTVSSAFANAPEIHHGNAFTHVRNAARPGGSGNLSYHSGPVQTGTHNTYAIYWGSSFSSGYSSIINSYFTNVAAASGQTTNVYYSDTQYYNSAGTHITYSEHFGGSWNDTALPSSSGCSSTAGGSLCVSDAQLQSEVSKAIAANSWPTGLGAEYFVFLANGVSTCIGSSCAFSQFCAYHSNYTLNGASVLYANMPYTGHNSAACGSGQSPNGNADADSTLNVTSHEANETITDALGSAWYDRSGNENGDKCAWNFGSPTGNYNQTINGAHYYLQGEWSNAHNSGAGGCTWSGY